MYMFDNLIDIWKLFIGSIIVILGIMEEKKLIQFGIVYLLIMVNIYYYIWFSGIIKINILIYYIILLIKLGF